MRDQSGSAEHRGRDPSGAQIGSDLRSAVGQGRPPSSLPVRRTVDWPRVSAGAVIVRFMVAREPRWRSGGAVCCSAMARAPARGEIEPSIGTRQHCDGVCSVRMFCSPDSRRRQSVDRHRGMVPRPPSHALEAVQLGQQLNPLELGGRSDNQSA